MTFSRYHQLYELINAWVIQGNLAVKRILLHKNKHKGPFDQKKKEKPSAVQCLQLLKWTMFVLGSILLIWTPQKNIELASDIY